MAYVYGHYKADTNELFYIGKGSGRRARQRYGRSEYWKRTVNKHGLVVKILEDGLTDEEAYNREKELIAEVGLNNLVNFCEGGKGMTSTDAQRLAQNPERRKKLSDALKRLAQDPEWIRKTTEANRTKAQDPEWKRKQKDGCKRRSQNPMYIKKITDISRQHSQDPEWKRKQAEGIAQDWDKRKLKSIRDAKGRFIKQALDNK